MRLDDRLRGHHQGSEDRWEALRALSSRPFCSCDGRRVSLGDLSAAYRYTTPRCLKPVLLASGWCLTPPRRALPLRRRSYGLMRQTTTLHQDFVFALIPSGLCRLLPAPAGRWSFPTLLCKSFPGCLGHDPGGSSGAPACYFPDVIGLPQTLPMGRLPAPVRGETSPRVMFRDRHHS